MIGSCVAVSVLHSKTSDSLVAMTITYLYRAYSGHGHSIGRLWNVPFGRYLGTTRNPFPDRIPSLLPLEC